MLFNKYLSNTRYGRLWECDGEQKRAVPDLTELTV